MNRNHNKFAIMKTLPESMKQKKYLAFLQLEELLFYLAHDVYVSFDHPMLIRCPYSGSSTFEDIEEQPIGI
ncbi:hypothetical protein BHU72_13375 [Desulfuribacillus stibiiarsenatis]|uniref:Uncharacterized protein n=1 Tax=Desulfuribacillus stibiiarsenatis TaxID=1390249 RepID=A0A1E5L8F4_9FIRM|nr:hypothetical protein BHU72_13375 [Desulfuribacillus stibiiarsenatis]